MAVGSDVLRERFERATELPLLVLAVAMVPLLLTNLIVDMSPAWESAFVAAGWLVWVLFAAEYAVRLTLAEERRRFIRREWVSLLIIVLPFLRPLHVARSARALRLLGLGRLAGFVTRASQELRRLLVRHHLNHVLSGFVVVILGSAGLVFALEADAGGGIDSFGDSLWWAATTVTTVGYGDTSPVTPAGRAVAVLLMISGIALFGVITANLAAYLVERSPGRSTDDRLDELLDRIADLDRTIASLRSDDGAGAMPVVDEVSEPAEETEPETHPDVVSRPIAIYR